MDNENNSAANVVAKKIKRPLKRTAFTQAFRKTAILFRNYKIYVAHPIPHTNLAYIISRGK